MIKAKELAWSLFWDKHKIDIYNRNECNSAVINPAMRYSIMTLEECNFIASLYHKRLYCKKEVLLWVDYNFETEEEAKAACQAHYQQMVESMVDMWHLIDIIKDAIEWGMKTAQLQIASDGLLFKKGAKEEAQKEFLKKLEQP